MTPEKTQSPIRYPSDLLDEEWEILQPIFAELEPYTTGRPRTTDPREILNAIFYLNGATCQQAFPFTGWLTITTTNGRTIERWKKSIPRYVCIYVKKVETQTRRQSSLIVKASREPQNPIWNQGSREASSLKEEK